MEREKKLVLEWEERERRGTGQLVPPWMERWQQEGAAGRYKSHTAWAPRNCPGLGCSLSFGLRAEFEGSPKPRETQSLAQTARLEKSQSSVWGDPSPAVWA